jgi:hypothetical protein
MENPCAYEPYFPTLLTMIGSFKALLDLVGKMYSKIQSYWRGNGRNHKGTKDTKIDYVVG